MRRKRASDEDLGGFAPPRKAETRGPEPPADDPDSYLDSWYQVLKGVGEDEVEGQTEG